MSGFSFKHRVSLRVICQMVFALGVGFVPSINFFFLGGSPLEKERSKMSGWWRRDKRRE